VSLINEALKRTRDTAANAGTPPPAAASYRIQSKVESSGTKGNFLITILIAGVVLVGIIVLGSRIAKRVQNVQDGFSSGTDDSVTDTPEVKTKPSRPAVKPATEPAPMPEVSPKTETASPLTPATTAVASTPDAKVTEDQIVAKLMERIKAEQAGAPKTMTVDPPKLVLQGITYARDGSEAMINNLTVREGDDIEGARVVTIESRRVKLDFNGCEISLRLP
jgi:cytoskeletal protein RodZ